MTVIKFAIIYTHYNYVDTDKYAALNMNSYCELNTKIRFIGHKLHFLHTHFHHQSDIFCIFLYIHGKVTTLRQIITHSIVKTPGPPKYLLSISAYHYNARLLVSWLESTPNDSSKRDSSIRINLPYVVRLDEWR